MAERLATEAAEFVRRRREEVFRGASKREFTGPAVRAKSTPTDPVTIVDTETERLLRDRLAELRPGEHVLGEEGGGSADGPDGRPTWVLDPIDGTVNFVYGLPGYVVSVAVQVDGRRWPVRSPTSSTVRCTPRRSAMARTCGAMVRRRRCGAARSTTCQCRWWAPDSATTRSCVQRQAAVLATLLPQIRDIRRIGSAALDLCMVAAGQLDAYFEDNLNVWDWAAGALIAAEAGANAAAAASERAVGGAGMVVAAAPGVDRGVDASAARSRRLLALESPRVQRNRVSTSRCGSLTASSDRLVGWPPVAGWTAPLRCRRCAPAR